MGRTYLGLELSAFAVVERLIHSAEGSVFFAIRVRDRADETVLRVGCDTYFKSRNDTCYGRGATFFSSGPALEELYTIKSTLEERYTIKSTLEELYTIKSTKFPFGMRVT